MAVRQIDLLQGTLDLLILQTLSRGPNHGYSIAQRIRELSDDVLRIEEGSLYPALYRLEQHGLIDSDWRVTENHRKAKFYELTRTGRAFLAFLRPLAAGSLRRKACRDPRRRRCCRTVCGSAGTAVIPAYSVLL